MRIYISSHDETSAKEVASALAGAGHLIVSAWHDASGGRPDRSDATTWRIKAEDNFEAIRSADALVLIGGTDRYPGGKYVEAGYANGHGVQVYNLGEVGNGLMHFASRVVDVADLLAALGA